MTPVDNLLMIPQRTLMHVVGQLIVAAMQQERRREAAGGLTLDQASRVTQVPVVL